MSPVGSCPLPSGTEPTASVFTGNTLAICAVAFVLHAAKIDHAWMTALGNRRGADPKLPARTSISRAHSGDG